MATNATTAMAVSAKKKAWRERERR